MPRQTANTWLEVRGAKPTEVGRGDRRRPLQMIRSYRDGLRFFAEETYSGAPGSASAEVGERILDTLGQKAAEACAELLDGRIGPEECHSPVWKLRFLFLNPVMIRLANRLLGFRNPIA